MVQPTTQIKLEGIMLHKMNQSKKKKEILFDSLV